MLFLECLTASWFICHLKQQRMCTVQNDLWSQFCVWRGMNELHEPSSFISFNEEFRPVLRTFDVSSTKLRPPVSIGWDRCWCFYPLKAESSVFKSQHWCCWLKKQTLSHYPPCGNSDQTTVIKIQSCCWLYQSIYQQSRSNEAMKRIRNRKRCNNTNHQTVVWERAVVPLTTNTFI